jgi:hypothetical protein
MSNESVDIDRSSIDAAPQPDALPAGGGQDPIGTEDYQQHANDAQTEAWREYDAEDEVTRLDRFGENVVRGEVVRDPDDTGPFPKPSNVVPPSELDPTETRR